MRIMRFVDEFVLLFFFLVCVIEEESPMVDIMVWAIHCTA